VSDQNQESRGLTTSDERTELDFLDAAMDVFVEHMQRAMAAKSHFDDKWERYKRELNEYRYARDRQAEIRNAVQERFNMLRRTLSDHELRELMGFTEWQEDIDRQVELRQGKPAGHGGAGRDEV
jgi:hypothetical protein